MTKKEQIHLSLHPGETVTIDTVDGKTIHIDVAEGGRADSERSREVEPAETTPWSIRFLEWVGMSVMKGTALLLGVLLVLIVMVVLLLMNG